MQALRFSYPVPRLAATMVVGVFRSGAYTSAVAPVRRATSVSAALATTMPFTATPLGA